MKVLYYTNKKTEGKTFGLFAVYQPVVHILGNARPNENQYQDLKEHCAFSYKFSTLEGLNV